MIVFICNLFSSSNYKLLSVIKQIFIKDLISFISRMAVVVYWLITAGCGPAKGSSIKSFWEKALPKNYENLPDRPKLFLNLFRKKLYQKRENLGKENIFRKSLSYYNIRGGK